MFSRLRPSAVAVTTLPRHPCIPLLHRLKRGLIQHASTVAELLARKHGTALAYVRETDPLSAVVHSLSHQQALIVVGPQGRVVGMLTATDVIKAMDRVGSPGELFAATCAKDIMVPSNRIAYTSPTDNVMTAAVLMSESHVSHLPVVNEAGNVIAIVSLNEIAQLTLEQSIGGKTNAVARTVRQGLAAASRVLVAQERDDKDSPLYLRTGYCSLPRAPRYVTATPPLTEDSLFTSHIRYSRSGRVAGCFGVADGVGSWHERGVDPRLYARRLMELCARSAWTALNQNAAPSPPVDLMTAAWEKTTLEKVIGSAAATVVALDGRKNQLTVHGVGDCGVVLLRDTNMRRVGTLLRGGTKMGIRPGWRVSARATQQLRDFNTPFQLGYAPGVRGSSFENPWQGETMSLPVHVEDVVVCASDGLFDNLDEVDLLRLVEEWDSEDLDRRKLLAPQSQSPPRGSGGAGAVPSAGKEAPPLLLDGSSVGAAALAHKLAHAAYVASLDRSRDGPFARLAKENDICWGGGRPDDITVVVGRVSSVEPTAPLVAGFGSDAEDATLRELAAEQAAALKAAGLGALVLR